MPQKIVIDGNQEIWDLHEDDTPATDAEKVAADANEDGNINAKDALEISKFAVGKLSCLSK